MAHLMEHLKLSLSARRAWIEIGIIMGGPGTTTVALRKESVDRNRASRTRLEPGKSSLSARRAWIEMRVVCSAVMACCRSLSARRAWIEIDIETSRVCTDAVSLSARRAWIEIPALRNLHTDVSSRSPQGERG